MFRHLARPRKESRALPTPLPLQPVGHGRKIKRMLQLEGPLADAMVGGWSLGIRAYKNTTAEQRAFRNARTAPRNVFWSSRARCDRSSPTTTSRRCSKPRVWTPFPSGLQ